MIIPNWEPFDGIEVRWGAVQDRISEISDESIDFCLTDPPYLLQTILRGDKTMTKDLKTGKVMGYGDGHAFLPYEEWLPEVFRVLKPEGSILVYEAPSAVGHLCKALTEAGFTIRRTAMWYCTNRINYGKGDRRRLRPVSDLGIWATKTDQPSGWFTNPDIDIPPPDIFKALTPKIKRGGNTIPGVKPLALLMPFIDWFTPEGGVVLDCFLGTGSTLAACHVLGRKCIGFELVPDRREIMEVRLKVGQTRLF